jgi:hypothetical protein
MIMLALGLAALAACTGQAPGFTGIDISDAPFQLHGCDEKEHALADFKGKYVMLFFASRSAPMSVPSRWRARSGSASNRGRTVTGCAPLPGRPNRLHSWKPKPKPLNSPHPVSTMCQTLDFWHSFFIKLDRHFHEISIK